MGESTEPNPDPPPGQRDARSPTEDEKVWSLLSHLGLFVLPIGGAAILMRTAGKRSTYVRQHTAEALNFQITLLVVAIVIQLPGILGLFRSLQRPASIVGSLIEVALELVVLVMFFVLPIRAAVRSFQGQQYRYPLTIRFVNPRLRSIKPQDVGETEQGYAAWMRKVEDDLAPPIDS